MYAIIFRLWKFATDQQIEDATKQAEPELKKKQADMESANFWLLLSQAVIGGGVESYKAKQAANSSNYATAVNAENVARIFKLVGLIALAFSVVVFISRKSKR